MQQQQLVLYSTPVNDSKKTKGNDGKVKKEFGCCNFLFTYIYISDFQTYVKRSLETLKFKVRELTTLVESNAAAFQSKPQDYDLPGFKFPLQTLEAIRELEKHLEENTEAKSRLVKQL